jgi:hypothetical protein
MERIQTKGEDAYIIDKSEEYKLGEGQYGAVYKIKFKQT